jgi:hypothetical protein
MHVCMRRIGPHTSGIGRDALRRIRASSFAVVFALAEMLHAYIAAGGIAKDRKGWLFRTSPRHSRRPDRHRDARVRLPQLLAGGGKALFRLSGGPGSLPRVAVCEAAIDALSLAAVELCRPDTLYAATAGGMGPATVAALQRFLSGLAVDPAGVLIAATDADIAGRRYAARLKDLAAEARVRFSAILPPDGSNDWNDFLCVKTRVS